MSACIDLIERPTTRIFDRVKEHPEKLAASGSSSTITC